MTASRQVTRKATARLVLLIGAAFTTALSAQTQPTFHTEANFVRVDVYATSRGVPVIDLSRDDFELFDGNAPQTIAEFTRFSAVRGPATPVARPDVRTLNASKFRQPTSANMV